ncbi:MAG: PAS domain S-box protein [Planctomycetota bacterium]|jgi:PAS domain S-box-containing protein
MSEEGKILIVDDEGTICNVLKGDLDRLGYSCVAAGDPKAALEELSGNNFDAMLIDLSSPEISGLDILRAGAISESIALWETAFDASPDMHIVVDTEARILQVNRATAERAGCEKQDLTGRFCHEAICCNDHAPEDCPFNQTQPGERGYHREFEQASWGGCFEISSAFLTDDSGEPWGSFHTIRDISDYKRTQEQIREAHGRLEMLLGAISSIMICLDQKGAVTRWNAEARNTFDIDPADVLGRNLSECNIPWDFDLIDKALADCRNSAGPIRVDDIPFRRRDGKDGFLGITLNPLIGEDGENDGFLLLGKDITGRKCLESQLVQAQKLESIGQLAAGIAHEINTPMQYVGDNIRFLQESFGQITDVIEALQRVLEATRPAGVSPQLIEETDNILREADIQYLLDELPQAIGQSLEGVTRVSEIVRAMRQFAHPGSDKKTAVDFNDIVGSTIAVSRNEWKYLATMETDFALDLPPVLCLPGELSQVILDLIINAVHAIGEVVGDASQGKGVITIRTRRDGDWVEIQVQDTGTGVPGDIESRIFDPFFTTKPTARSVGQGLTLAHSVIVEKHGGTISFETEAGVGTTFFVRLPIDPELKKQKHPSLKETADVR